MLSVSFNALIVANNGSTVIANGLRLLNNDAGVWGVSASFGSTVMFFNGEVTNAFTGRVGVELCSRR